MKLVRLEKNDEKPGLIDPEGIGIYLIIFLILHGVSLEL